MQEKLSFSDFWADADRLFRSEYGAGVEDLMLGEDQLESAWQEGETPSAYVQRIGERFDLVKRKDFTFEMALLTFEQGH